MNQATLGFERKDRIELADGRIILGGPQSWTDNGKKVPPRVLQFYNPHRGTSYLVRSALHKEIRRGNIKRSIAFAAWADKCKKGSGRTYLRRILFEETRNVRILQMFRDKAETRDIVIAMCRSAKDWEVDQGHGICFPKWYKVVASHNWYGKYDSWSSEFQWPDDPEQVIKDAAAAGDHETLMDLVVMTSGPCLPRSEEVRDLIRPLLSKIASERVDPKWRDAVRSLRTKKHHEEVLLLAQIITGEWDEDASNHLHPAQHGRRVDIPIFETYVFDPHTMQGNRIFKARKAAGELDWHLPMPPDFDMRWSGRDAGTLWRYLAMEQHGTTDLLWEDVKLEGQLKVNWDHCYKGEFE